MESKIKEISWRHHKGTKNHSIRRRMKCRYKSQRKKILTDNWMGDKKSTKDKEKIIKKQWRNISLWTKR